MKRCPKCNQTFSDETYFCLEDGTPLPTGTTGDDFPTVPMMTNSAPTQVISPPSAAAPKDSSKWLFLIIGVLATALAALAIFLFLQRGDDPKSENSVSKTNENKNPTENVPAKNVQENNANANVSKPSINPNLSPGGNWSGDWNSTGTYSTYFTATVNLTDEGAGKVSGEIVWTLRRTNNPKKVDKVGSSATEYVRGTFNPATRQVFLRGYRKDDPNDIVIYDAYNLILSENNLALTGRSKGGNFALKR